MKRLLKKNIKYRKLTHFKYNTDNIIIKEFIKNKQPKGNFIVPDNINSQQIKFMEETEYIQKYFNAY